MPFSPRKLKKLCFLQFWFCVMLLQIKVSFVPKILAEVLHHDVCRQVLIFELISNEKQQIYLPLAEI